METELFKNCLVDSIFDFSFFLNRKACTAVSFVSKMAAATRTLSSRENYAKTLKIQETTELFCHVKKAGEYLHLQKGLNVAKDG